MSLIVNKKISITIDAVSDIDMPATYTYKHDGDFRMYENAFNLYGKVMKASVVVIDGKIFKDRTCLFDDEEHCMINDMVLDLGKMSVDSSSDNEMLILTSPSPSPVK